MTTFRHKRQSGFITLSEKVCVSDPCYKINDTCNGNLDILPGKWDCRYEKKFINSIFNDERILNIELRHERYRGIIPNEEANFIVDVDSGQAGVYDYEYFKNHCDGNESHEIWYDNIFKRTCKHFSYPNPEYVKFTDYPEMLELNKKKESFTKEEFIEKYHEIHQKWCNEYIANGIDSLIYDTSEEAGTMDDKCFVSGSGWGDGGYFCYVGRNKRGRIVAIKIEYIKE